MKIPKDTLRDHRMFRRQWDIFFYCASSRCSIALDEIYQLFDGRWTMKTLRRDMQLLEDYGIWKTTNNHGVPMYRFQGSPGPFVRQNGKKWCVSCRQFVKLEQFGNLRSSSDGVQYQCRPCKNTILKRYHHRNQTYVNSRQKRYYRSRVKRQLLETGMMFTPQMTALLRKP